MIVPNMTVQIIEGVVFSGFSTKKLFMFILIPTILPLLRAFAIESCKPRLFFGDAATQLRRVQEELLISHLSAAAGAFMDKSQNC